MLAKRPWEIWTPSVAKKVDEYWTSNVDEMNHRKKLASVVINNMRGCSTILEVGCGTGLVYGALADIIPDIKYKGVDNSRPMLRIAKSRFPDVDFDFGDAFELEVDQHDMVICFEVLSHLPEIDIPLKEMRRVAKRKLLFSVWPSPNRDTLEGADNTWLHSDANIKHILKGVKSIDSYGVSTVALYIVEV